METQQAVPTRELALSLSPLINVQLSTGYMYTTFFLMFGTDASIPVVIMHATIRLGETIHGELATTLETILESPYELVRDKTDI